MLKLRKNKKGFTLVELIVVIAIMAVLAGTVAGVTVTQLNKKTDDTNKIQAQKIATSISGLVLEDGSEYVKAASGSASDNNTPSENNTPAASTTDTFQKVADLITELKTEFAGKEISNTKTPKKGEFGIYLNTDKTLIVVCFGAKTNDYKVKGYQIDLNGVVKEISANSADNNLKSLPDMATNQGDS